jgi:nucleotide-binding universal stress UspA family protein
MSEMLFKRILVPYDESKPSRDALEKAIDLAKVSNRTKLFVLHVVPQVPLPPLFNRSIRTSRGEPMTMAEYFKEIHDELKEKAKEKLAHVEDKCETDGINTEVHISSGNPAYKIVEFAKDERIDLIVMGSRFADYASFNNAGERSVGRGRRIMRKMLLRNLGSISRSVAERAPCPILLLRP